MTTKSQIPLEKLLTVFEAKNMSAAMACVADDAVLYDPQYPEPQMQGKTAIQSGFEFAFNLIERSSFHMRHVWANTHSGAAEVDTHHVFQDGTEAHFPQLFVFETPFGHRNKALATSPGLCNRESMRITVRFG